nr:hypothetical protein [Candidatus Dependentiae bacterium]
MWFFLQKNLKEKNRSFGILVALSGIAHGSACALFILMGRVISSPRVVGVMTQTVRVSMRSGGTGLSVPGPSTGSTGIMGGSTGSPVVDPVLKKQEVFPLKKEEPKIQQPPSLQVPVVATPQGTTTYESSSPVKALVPPVSEPQSPKNSSVTPVVKDTKKNVQASPIKKEAPVKKEVLPPVSQKAPVKKGMLAAPLSTPAGTKAAVTQKPQVTTNEKETELFSPFVRPARTTSAKKEARSSSENTLVAQSTPKNSPPPVEEAPLFSSYKKRVKEISPGIKQEQAPQQMVKPVVKEATSSPTTPQASAALPSTSSHAISSPEGAQRINGEQVAGVIDASSQVQEVVSFAL